MRQREAGREEGGLVCVAWWPGCWAEPQAPFPRGKASDGSRLQAATPPWACPSPSATPHFLLLLGTLPACGPAAFEAQLGSRGQACGGQHVCRGISHASCCFRSCLFPQALRYF